MATHTTYYNLTKPAQNDKVNIGVLNDNADIIDTALHNKVDSVDLTASNVMMSDDVTSVEDRIEPHDTSLQTRISIASYNDNNPYICPADGYALIGADATGRSGYIKVNGLVMLNVVSGTQAALSVYVRKGSKLSCSLSGNGTVAYFYPLS